jgi:hypothetical protein
MSDGPDISGVGGSVGEADAAPGRPDVSCQAAVGLPALDGPAPPIVSWIVSLLAEARIPAEDVECRLLPADRQYAVLLEIPRQAGKGVLLPRRPLERGFIDPVARAWVRNLLRASVEALRSRRGPGEPRLLSYFAALRVRSLPGPRCTHCEGPLLADDPLVVDGVSRWHLACPPAW